MDLFPLSELGSYGYSQAFDKRKGGHHGTDIFAPSGSTVVAVASGMARATNDPKGGQVIYLDADDGAKYYYAHLADWTAPLQVGRTVRVDAGAVLGHVGNTGNAQGTSPHLHFQVWLPAEGLVDPYYLLRQVDPKPPDSDLPDLPVTDQVPSIPELEPQPSELGLGVGLGLLLLLALSRK